MCLPILIVYVDSKIGNTFVFVLRGFFIIRFLSASVYARIKQFIKRIIFNRTTFLRISFIRVDILEYLSVHPLETQRAVLRVFIYSISKFKISNNEHFYFFYASKTSWYTTASLLNKNLINEIPSPGFN